MSGSVNKVILIGNLGRDPEVRTMPSGDKMVSFSLATTESWRDKNTGERRDKTEWHNIVIFNENLGRVAEQYCKKGSKIYIEGQLQTREYQDKDGNQRRATEVVLQRFTGKRMHGFPGENPLPGPLAKQMMCDQEGQRGP